MPLFEDEQSYLEYLESEIALPDGFSAGSVSLSFTPEERPTLEPYRMNLSGLVCKEPTDAFAGVFTRNGSRRDLARFLVLPAYRMQPVGSIPGKYGHYRLETSGFRYAGKNS